MNFNHQVRHQLHILFIEYLRAIKREIAHSDAPDSVKQELIHCDDTKMEHLLRHTDHDGLSELIFKQHILERHEVQKHYEAIIKYIKHLCELFEVAHDSLKEHKKLEDEITPYQDKLGIRLSLPKANYEKLSALEKNENALRYIYNRLRKHSRDNMYGARAISDWLKSERSIFGLESHLSTEALYNLVNPLETIEEFEKVEKETLEVTEKVVHFLKKYHIDKKGIHHLKQLAQKLDPEHLSSMSMMDCFYNLKELEKEYEQADELVKKLGSLIPELETFRQARNVERHSIEEELKKLKHMTATPETARAEMKQFVENSSFIHLIRHFVHTTEHLLWMEEKLRYSLEERKKLLNREKHFEKEIRSQEKYLNLN